MVHYKMQFKIGDMVRTRTKDIYSNLFGTITGIVRDNRWYVTVPVNGSLMELPYSSYELRKHTGIRKIISGCVAQ